MKLTGVLVTGLVGLSIWLWQWRGAPCASLSVSNLITVIEKGCWGVCFLGGFYFVYFNIPFLRPQYIRTWLMFMMVRAYILLLYIVFLYSFEYVIVNDC